MARRICALAALAAARAYDWTTPDAGLTPFNCTAFPNPIQVLLPDGQSPPYDVSELDLATGAPFFSNNGGYGLFEVIIPPGGIPIPEGRDGCWNTGDPSVPGNTHYSCGEKGDRQQGLSFQIKWVAQSATTSNNDGSACPGIAAPIFPSMAPTITETPTQQPTIGLWSNPEKPFDCDAHPNPIQVYGPQKPPPPFNTEELDLGTGDYTAVADFSPVPPTTPAYGSQNVKFNKDISGWVTSSVTTMAGMFAYAPKFDQPLQSWDVSGLTGFTPGTGPASGPGLYEMFTRATAFDQDLGWCVSTDVNPAPELMFLGAVCGPSDCGVRTVADPATDC